MKRERLLELAGIKLKEDVELSRLDPTDYHSDELVKFVAQHMWHEYHTGEQANKFLTQIRDEFERLRDSVSQR